MLEIWKDIKGYEGLYQVSNTGKVRSLNYNKTGEIKELKPQINNCGYYRVGLRKKRGKQIHFFIHRLVGEAFIPNPDNLPEINHKDECKTNNYVDNLEWCSKSYNTNYGLRNEKTAKKDSKIVLQFTLDGEFIKEWESIKNVEMTLGINRSCITYVCKGKHKTAGGYKWKYK